MGRLTHFEIHATEPERIIPFYEEVFGWSFAKWEGPMEYWLITTGPESEPGIHGGLGRRMGPAPAPGAPVSAFVCTASVEDVDRAMERALAAGGRTALPKMAVPGVGWLAYVLDTDGNIVGMMQNDPRAK